MTAEELLERLCDPANTQERYEITPHMDLPAVIHGAGEALKSHPPVEIHRRLCIAIECAAKLLTFVESSAPASFSLTPSEVKALRKFLDDHDLDYACGDGPIASAAALDAIERILDAAERKP